MKAQIYVKSDDDNTSIVVSDGKGNPYFHQVMPIPELTGIQRGVSFVKHNLDADVTEIYPDKLGKEVLDDAYINYCKVNPVIGNKSMEKARKLCESKLAMYHRWNTRGDNSCER